MNIFRRLLFRIRGIVLYSNVQLKGEVTIQPLTIIGIGLHPEDSCYCKLHSETIINKGCYIGPFVTIYRGATISKHVIIEPFARIGADTHIGEGTRVVYGARIHDRVIIGSNCIIAGNCSDDVRIGDEVKHFGRLAHAFNKSTSDWSTTDEAPPVIEKGAVIGANALIIGPITIGAYSYIAAGEVVRRSVPSSHIVYKGLTRPGGSWGGQLGKSGFFSNERP